ncbi:MAG: adenylate/guanylate cyclase domain-containing protein [Verrucomicrobiota bacterium]
MRIGKRLIAGFGCILVTIVLLAVLAIFQINRLAQQTRLIFEHPFTVMTEIAETEVRILEMHREMKDLVAYPTIEEKIASGEKVQRLEARVLFLLERVRERFLGDLSEIDALRAAVLDWRPIRDEVIYLNVEKEDPVAAEITRGKGARHVVLIQEKLASVRNFAQEKAAQAKQRANQLKQRSVIVTLLAMITVFVIALALALRITRSITDPLSQLDHSIARVSEGDYKSQIRSTSKDELGRLTRSFNEMTTRIDEQNRVIAEKNRENESLLLNVLPEGIAGRLKKGEQRIADFFPEVSVLFADIVGFTPMTRESTPQNVVEFLDELFSAFDSIAQKYGVEKIKTIGDAYMAVSGLSQPNDSPTEALVFVGLELIDATELINEKYGTEVSLRVGIHSGPVVAGVIGKSKFIYDLWGDTVNIANRMESHGIAGRVQTSDTVKQKVESAFSFEPRRGIEIKGRGKQDVWLVIGPKPKFG